MLNYNDNDDIVDIVRVASTSIENGRTLQSALDHLRSEVDELQEEVNIFVSKDGNPGADGILGETMDVVNCALDILFQYDPYITQKEIADIMRRKCDKWAVKYKDFEAK